MNRISQLLILFAFFFQTQFSFAQTAEDAAHWEAYHSVDIAHFFAPDETASARLFYALKHQIAGDIASANVIMEQLLADTTWTDGRTELARILYDNYWQQRNFSAALWLDQAEGLDYGSLRAGEFARQYPGPSFEGKNTTSVPFDGFYITGKIGEDSIRIFLDTGAPGITIDARWADRRGWALDTTRAGRIVEPYIGIEYLSYPTVMDAFSIGDFSFRNLPANAVRMTEEQWQKKTSAGIQRYDIIMGIDAFYGLIDGVTFDYANERFTLFAELPATDATPSYMRVEGKPAVSLQLGDQRYPAFMDTGSPRHVFTKEMIAAADTLGSFTDRYGSYEYKVYTLKMDRLLNLSDVTIEAADYARRSSGKAFNISAHFGSFREYKVHYDFNARRVEVTKP